MQPLIVYNWIHVHSFLWFISSYVYLIYSFFPAHYSYFSKCVCTSFHVRFAHSSASLSMPASFFLPSFLSFSLSLSIYTSIFLSISLSFSDFPSTLSVAFLLPLLLPLSLLISPSLFTYFIYSFTPTLICHTLSVSFSLYSSPSEKKEIVFPPRVREPLNVLLPASPAYSQSGTYVQE